MCATYFRAGPTAAPTGQPPGRAYISYACGVSPLIRIPSNPKVPRLIRCLFAVWLACQGAAALGQNMLWEKRYSWPGPDILTSVVSLDDGTVLAAGGSAFSHGISLLRLTEDGDTVYLRGLPISQGYHSSIRLCRFATGEVYVANNTPRAMVLAKVDPYYGTLIWSRNLPVITGPPAELPNVNHITEGPHHTILLASDCADPLGHATSIGYVACYDSNGTLIWGNEMREHPDFTLCNHVEQTPRGTVLVSGTAGSRIWAAELTADSGRELRRATFYQSQGLIYFDYQMAWVSQAPNDRYLVGGTTSQYRGYLGLHQGWAGPKIWGGESLRNIDVRVVNQDGSIVFLNEQSTASRINRIRADSSLVWSIPNPSPVGSIGTKFDAYASLPDSSAIGVGVVAYSDSTDQDWYVSRISNFGIPYNPALATAAAKPAPAAPHPYPNPCRQSLGFAGLQGKAELTLHDMQGRPAGQKDLAPGQMADLSALPPGLYHYRLQSAGRSHRGRIVKE